jgi:hypothetical protein
MPMWNRDRPITRDQYEVVEDTSVRPKYGTVIMACAKPGTDFHHRLASWPLAFEDGAREMLRRHLPGTEFSVYVHGRSTGGPFSFLVTQRVPNIVGVIGMENSPFGYIFRAQSRASGNAEGLTFGDVVPFNCLQVRTWRDAARMLGPESFLHEGAAGLARLPMLMEEVFEEWGREKTYPGFKAEGMVHFGATEQLEAAARATARRLDLSSADAAALVERYTSYAHELRGEGVKPVPPVIFGIAAASPDHDADRYRKVTLPMFAAMKPAPKVHLVEFGAGTHFYAKPEPGLPAGLAPAVVQMWYDAIMNGYYEEYSRTWGAHGATEQP